MSYATTDELKAYIPGITATTEINGLLQACLNRATDAIDAFCGRKFRADADATHYFDALRDIDGSTLYLDDELAQITSITNGDGHTIAIGGYATEPRNQAPYFAIKLRSSSGASWTYIRDHEDAIAVTGRWAFSVTPPADIVQACLRLSAFYYKLKDSQVFDVTADPQKGTMTIPKGIPQDVKLLLSNRVRVI